jgi:hypothetical protein
VQVEVEQVEFELLSISVCGATSYPITVGGGGAGRLLIRSTEVVQEQILVFQSITSAGGGGGGTSTSRVRSPGGSGGGGQSCNELEDQEIPLVSPPQGNAGGMDQMLDMYSRWRWWSRSCGAPSCNNYSRSRRNRFRCNPIFTGST